MDEARVGVQSRGLQFKSGSYYYLKTSLLTSFYAFCVTGVRRKTGEKT